MTPKAKDFFLKLKLLMEDADVEIVMDTDCDFIDFIFQHKDNIETHSVYWFSCSSEDISNLLRGEQ